MTQKQQINNSRLEIKVQTKELAHALSFASSIIEKRNVASELNNIKLSAKNGTFEIGATDMDIYLNQTVGAEIIAEGATTVSAQTLLDIVRKIPDTEIIIRQKKTSDQLELIGKICQFDLLTLPALQFPEMETVDSEISVTIPCEYLARIIEYTNFAMSNDETRYNLNGIYLHIKNHELISAATDGHRLSVSSCLLNNSNTNFGVIIPKKTVQEVLKITKDSKNIHTDIAITLGTNKVMFTCNNLIIVSKLIDGVFPEYNSFIPVNNQNKLIVNTKLLADAIDRVSTVTVDKFRAIKFNIGNNNLDITASGESRGAAKESLAYSMEENSLCNFNGQEMVIGFNPKYMHDVLGTIKEPLVELYLNDSFSPVLIKSKQYPGDSFVVMPVKV